MSPRTMYFKVGGYEYRVRVTKKVIFDGQLCYKGKHVNLSTNKRYPDGIFKPSERIKKPISTLPD